MGSKRAHQLAKLQAERETQRARYAGTGGQKSAATTADPLIGGVAHAGRQIVCDGGACIIAGSRNKMQEIQQRWGPRFAGRHTLEAAKFWHVVPCLQRGAAYCRIGMPLTKEDFRDPGPLGLHLVRVQQFGYLTNV